jgi:hypothetical protein
VSYRVAPFLPKAISLFIVAVVLLTTTPALAATLTLSPASGSYNVGSTISVSVLANSSDTALNAVSGTLTFSRDLLEVTSVSKNSSIISLWVREPSYSNEAGNVTFEGIVLNPGYTGNGGRVVTITFRVKKAGTAVLSYGSGEILANDGVGTSILTSLGKASYTLTAPVVPPVVDEESAPKDTGEQQKPQPKNESPRAVITADSPTLPTINSKTHQVNAWSSSTEGVFTFSFNESVTAMRLLLDDVPDSIPAILYQPPITEKKLTELPEGTSYLHVQYKDEDGWGEVLHYALQVDTKPPEQIAIRETLSTPDTKTFTFMTLDTGSGVHHYEVRVNDGLIETVPSQYEKTEYTVKDLPPGQYMLTVKAFDQAGNSKEQALSFVVSSSTEDENNFLEGFTGKEILIVCLLLGIIGGMAGFVFRLRRRRDAIDRVLERKKEFESKITVARTIILLRDDFKKDLRMLERVAKRRELTKEEQKLLMHYQTYITKADDYLRDEILEEEPAVEALNKTT